MMIDRPFLFIDGRSRRETTVPAPSRHIFVHTDYYFNLFLTNGQVKNRKKNKRLCFSVGKGVQAIGIML